MVSAPHPPLAPAHRDAGLQGARVGACTACTTALTQGLYRGPRSVQSGGLDGNSIGNPFMPLADGEEPYGQIPAAADATSDA